MRHAISRTVEVVERSAEMRRLGEHRDRRRAAALVRARLRVRRRSPRESRPSTATAASPRRSPPPIAPLSASRNDGAAVADSAARSHRAPMRLAHRAHAISGLGHDPPRCSDGRSPLQEKTCTSVTVRIFCFSASIRDAREIVQAGAVAGSPSSTCEHAAHQAATRDPRLPQRLLRAQRLRAELRGDRREIQL